MLTRCSKAERGLTAVMSTALLGACTTVNGLAPEDVLLFSWEPVTIKPQIAVTETFNDNLFSQRGRSTSDFITTFSPGVNFLLGRKSDNYVTLSYTLNQHLYADRNDLNSMEHLIELNSSIEKKRIGLRGIDRIQLLSSPVGSEVKLLEFENADQPAISVEGNIDRITFYDNYTLSYSISEKTSVYIQGLHSAADYEKGVRLLDYRTLSGTLGFGYRAFAKTQFFGEVYRGYTESEANIAAPAFADLTFIGGALGARGQFTPKITGQVRLGFESREFKTGAGGSDAPVVGLSLNYAYSEKTRLNLNYSRRQDVSVQYGEQSYTADIIGAQFTQAIGGKGKWRATLGGYYGSYDYDDTPGLRQQRSYDLYALNFNLAYQIQVWLSTSLGYSRTSVLTDGPGLLGYDINRVMFRVALGY